ncbi:MAG: aminodeoxychorismate synthase component I [Actinomycetota bacterium]|nr:aminodeoxychorismate synthase component I [Actinomycetota bacterium]
MHASAGSPWARFDDLVGGSALLFAEPRQVLVAHRTADVAPVLEEVEQATRRGRWAFGHVSYEAASGLDPVLPTCAPAEDGPPLAWFGLGDEPARVPPVPVPPGRDRAYRAQPWRPDWTLPAYARDLATVRMHIAAGDVYQCNLTSRVRGAVAGDLLQLYADLVHNQRARYAAYLDEGRHVVASASPELFFEWSGRRLLTRPMKGTAARGRDEAEDEDRLRRLLASPKERAENIMIVDLLRNDLGRVAEVGSVEVPGLCRPERYETVWQLTSDVAGTLPPGTQLLDVFRALFPCGSVTGAPKRRAMQVLRDVEDAPRGVYCGAVGVVAPPDAPVRARFSVAIRTAVVDRASGTAVYGTGSGITWDSDPVAEAAELQAKAAIVHAPHEQLDLLETMACVPAEGVRHLDRHLRRLASSARYAGFRLDLDDARRRVLETVRGSRPCRVRLLLSRDGSVRVERLPLPPADDRPVTLAVDPDPVDSADRWLRHKTTRRRVYEDRTTRHPHVDDVVLTNERGALTETTIANLAVRLDGVWWTPPTGDGCLPGVERGRLLELGRLRERSLTSDDLRRAEALAVVSSVRGWRTAVLADESALSARAGRP